MSLFTNGVRVNLENLKKSTGWLLELIRIDRISKDARLTHTGLYSIYQQRT